MFHIETDFQLPSRMGERLDLTLVLLTRWDGHLSALSLWDMSAELTAARPHSDRDDVVGTHQSVELPQALCVINSRPI